MRFTIDPPLPSDRTMNSIQKYLSDDRIWYTLAGDLSAPPKHRAASILVDFHALERTCLGPFTFRHGPFPESYGVDVRDAAITMTGVATALENLPEITVRQLADKDANAFLMQECRRFFELQQTLPVPESWQLEEPTSWPHMFRTWHALCDRIALEAHYAKLIEGEFHSCAPEQVSLYGVPRTPALPKSGEDVVTDLCQRARETGLTVVDAARMPRLIRWLAIRFGRVA